MAQTLTTTGYIVADNEGIIHGVGASAHTAYEDMRRTLDMARIKLLNDDDDSTAEHGSWTRESGMRIWPATAALLAEIENRGGNLGWRQRDGIACTKGEAES